MTYQIKIHNEIHYWAVKKRLRVLGIESEDYRDLVVWPIGSEISKCKLITLDDLYTMDKEEHGDEVWYGGEKVEFDFPNEHIEYCDKVVPFSVIEKIYKRIRSGQTSAGRSS